VAATPTLNERAQRLADYMASTAPGLRIAVQQTPAGAKVLDCGVNVPGGLQAGLALARVCLAGLAEVSVAPGDVAGSSCPLIQVATDHPVAACMAAQYAGWEIKLASEGFAVMGSGPMRAAYGKEDLFEHIPGREKPPVAVGILETNRLPGDAVARYVADAVGLPPAKITLLAAPATSLAGTIQVVARSVETALHKLHALKFDLKQVVSGFGMAPMPPVATDVLHAIGRTNDAILYGGRVTLWVEAEDDQLAEVGPRLPSCAEADYGAPFVEILKSYHGDFYQIDPRLFSPAEVYLCNLRTGRSHAFGRVKPEVLWRSFFSGE
jgi:methenyltetrahydromethanopterin cyclohydrolase